MLSETNSFIDAQVIKPQRLVQVHNACIYPSQQCLGLFHPSSREERGNLVLFHFVFCSVLKKSQNLFLLTTDTKKYTSSPDLQGTPPETLHGCLEFQMLLNTAYICSNIYITMMLNHRNNNHQQQLIIK